MAVTNYSKLLEPGQIGKVTTRNRIYKSAAGMHSFEEYEFDQMNDNTLGLLRSAGQGRSGDHRGRGADHRLSPGMPLAPSLPDGRGQIHPRDEAAGGPHPQPWLPDLHADGARRSLAEPAVPQPSGHVRRAAHRRLGREHPPSQRLPSGHDPAPHHPRDRGHHPQVHRRGRAGAEGRLRRRGPQHGQHPHHHELHVSVVEQARRRVRRHPEETGQAGSTSSAGIKQRCGDDFPDSRLRERLRDRLPAGRTRQQGLQLTTWPWRPWPCSSTPGPTL